MLELGRERIINISSVGGHNAFRTRTSETFEQIRSLR